MFMQQFNDWCCIGRIRERIVSEATNINFD
jgi:hypothetical protein